MTIPDIVFDSERLAALDAYAILDTPDDAGFDDIVFLASQICNAPVALVSLVASDRQWFKARVGFEGCETDLNSSVCAHALASPGLLVIPDLSKDGRTRFNPLVVGDPHIRFYAGAPLIAANGQPLGSLCVIDSTPRPQGLSEQQGKMLQALGRQVMTQLELRRAVGERDSLTIAKASAEMLERASSSLYKSLFAAIDAGFCIIEMKFADGVAVDYRFIEVNPAFDAQTGLHDARGKWMRDLAPAHEQYWFDLYGKVALTGEAVQFENPAEQLGHRWYDVHAFPIETPGTRRVGILFNDISARKEVELARREVEAAQVLVNQELSHRMKNSFAMVQAIATQTLRPVAERGAVEAFTSRLQALSKAHDVLLQKNWVAAPLWDVLEAVFGSLEDSDRFDLSGPLVDLGAKATLSLSLLTHELMTNAIKHGALSTEAGRVAIVWRLEGEGDATELVLTWTETGGPPAHEPEGKGFGSKLIQLGLVGAGGVTLDYAATGLRAEFWAPLDQVRARQDLDPLSAIDQADA